MLDPRLIKFRLKETVFTIFSFLMVTMSLYHVFFDNKSPEIKINKEASIAMFKNRDSIQNELLEQLNNSVISKDEYYFEMSTLLKQVKIKKKKLKNEKRVIAYDFSFRGRSSFHFWIFVFGLVTLGLFFSCKSLHHDIINGSSFKVCFMSICGIVISLFWVIHLTFMTQNDFTKNSYVGLILLCSIMFGIFGYYSIKYIANKKLKKEKLLDNAFNTIGQLQKKVLIEQEEQRANERQRISEELHDGVLGKLFGTRMGLGFLDVFNDQSKEKYQVFLRELQQIEKEIREVSHQLSTNLDGSDISFAVILEQLLKDKSKLGNFNYELDVDNSISWEIINEIEKVNLHRIIQELLQNVIKHAKAENVTVNILKYNRSIVVEIVDDGVGFDISKRKKGIGINNIKSRVKRLKGSVVIDSIIRKGTKIKIKLPYEIKEIEAS